MFQAEFDKFQNTGVMKRVRTGIVTWEYYVHGDGLDSVLILNGGGSVPEASFMYVNALSQKFRVITPSIPEVTTVKECLDGIITILQTEGVKKFHVIGFSMGGMLAQCLVRQHPELIKKLILFVSMLPSKEYAKKYRRYGWGISIVPEFLFGWISKRSLHKQVDVENFPGGEEGKEFWKKFFDWEFDSGKIDKKLLLATSKVLVDYFGNYEFTPDDLTDWSGEILIFDASEDTVVSQEERARLRLMYPFAELVTQKSSGHFGEGLLRPEKHIQKMLDFLK